MESTWALLTVHSAKRAALAQSVYEASPAEQTEVTVISELSDLTRFTKELVHQNVARSDVTVRVRAMIGQRTGVATTNLLDEAALRRVADRASAIARLAPEDAGQPPLVRVGAPLEAPPGAYADATAGATPEARADHARAIFSVADRFGYWPAGFSTTSAAGVTIVNSSGTHASFDGTDAAINVKMNAPDSSGYAEAYDSDVGKLNARAVADVAAEKARAGAQPRAVEPGPWTVILEPAAFGEFIAYLTNHFSAQTFSEGASFLSDGLGKTYVGENVTIMDDYAHPLAPSMPFDFEGHPTQRIALIEGGIGRAVVTDNYWAQKLKMGNTGHALPAPNAWGPQPTHLVVSHGTKPLAELIDETERGLLVSRFWYIRTVDPRKAIVTGMTRDGTFLIERGKISAGVRNLRFNESILEALRRCEFSNAPQRTGTYAYSLVVPAAKIEGFTFSSSTEF